MNNEEIFDCIKKMLNSNNYHFRMRIGKLLVKNNVKIKDLFNKLVIYNGNNEKIIVPTLGKGVDRKYLFNKHKIVKLA